MRGGACLYSSTWEPGQKDWKPPANLGYKSLSQANTSDKNYEGKTASTMDPKV